MSATGFSRTPPARHHASFARARAYVSKIPGAVQGAHGDVQTLAVANALVWDFALNQSEALTILRAAAGNYFRREWFGVVDCVPKDAQITARVRYWDRAATERRGGNDPDATVGVLLSKDSRGAYYVEHVLKLYATPHAVEQAMVNCARADGRRTTVAFMQDPGSAGVAEAQATARALDGFSVRFAPATGDKETRAKPVSAQAEAGNVKLVRGPWNDEFLRALENFPTARHDDEVDALSGAHQVLSDNSSGAWDSNAIQQALAANRAGEDPYGTDFDVDFDFPDLVAGRDY